MKKYRMMKKDLTRQGPIAQRFFPVKFPIFSLRFPKDLQCFPHAGSGSQDLVARIW